MYGNYKNYLWWKWLLILSFGQIFLIEECHSRAVSFFVLKIIIILLIGSIFFYIYIVLFIHIYINF